MKKKKIPFYLNYVFIFIVGIFTSGLGWIILGIMRHRYNVNLKKNEKMNNKVLREFRPAVRYENGADISLVVLYETLWECTNRMQIPVKYETSKLGYGKKTEECIIMFHPEHETDYLKFCIRIKREGIFAFVIVETFGTSKLGMTKYTSDEIRKGGSNVGEMILREFMSYKLAPDKEEFEEERRYYDCLNYIFDEVIAYK